MNIKIKRMGAVKLPRYAHPGDAGMDVHALRDYGLHPGERIVLPLGFAIEFPDGFVALMFDKSSLPKNGGLHVIGGVFDSGYRGEYNVQIINLAPNLTRFAPGIRLPKSSSCRSALPLLRRLQNYQTPLVGRVDSEAPGNKMSKEILSAQQEILALGEKKAKELLGLPKQRLEDLLHEAEENIFNETFSLRTAAEIVRYACQKNLGML